MTGPAMNDQHATFTEGFNAMKSILTQLPGLLAAICVAAACAAAQSPVKIDAETISGLGARNIG